MTAIDNGKQNRKVNVVRLIAFVFLAILTLYEVSNLVRWLYFSITNDIFPLEFFLESVDYFSFFGTIMTLLMNYIVPILLVLITTIEAKRFFGKSRTNGMLIVVLASIVTIITISSKLINAIEFIRVLGSVGFKYVIISLLSIIILLFFIVVSIRRIIENKKNQTYSDNHKLTSTEVGLLIILSIITLGIYYLIWAYKIMSYFEPKRDKIPAVQLLLIIFIPFYVLYWLYKTAEDVNKLQKEKGVDVTSFSTLAVVLGLFGLGIISIAIIQDNINKIEFKSEEVVA